MREVSRETTRPPAEVLAALFPAGEKQIGLFVDLLVGIGSERGLIGPREVPRVWERHILNCAVIREVFRENMTVCDLGSGAGLPGLVLAISRPDVRFTLVEPLLRRTVFLREVLTAVGLSNVEIVRARAEDLSGVRRFDAVTARAVAPLGRLAGWALPLCREGGELIALKGASAAEEVRAAQPALTKLGAGHVRIEYYGEGITTPPATVVRIQSGPHARPRQKDTG